MSSGYATTGAEASAISNYVGAGNAARVIGVAPVAPVNTNPAPLQTNPAATGAQTVATPPPVTPVTPVTPAPTPVPVTASTISTPTTPVPLPTNTNTSSGAASSVIGTMSGINANLNSNIQSSVDAAANKRDNQESTVQAYIQTLLGEGADVQAMNNAAGIPDLMQTSKALTQEYNTKTLAYNAQAQGISQDASLSSDQRARQLAATTNDHATQMTDLGIRANIAQGNYQAAQELVDKQVDIKYGNLKDLLATQVSLLNNDQVDLSDKQKTQLETLINQNSKTIDEVTYQAHAVQDTKTQAQIAAAQNGAPPDVMAAIQSATTPGEAIAAGGQWLKQGNYSVVQTGIDMNTGLPTYSAFNAKTGQFANGSSAAANGTTTTTGNPGNTVSTPSGKSYDLSTYAPNNPAYNAIINKAVQALGPITSAADAQAAITKAAPTSPVTGQMIMDAATKYNVDPALLIAQMQNESGFATSTVGKADNNTGGIKFAGQENAQPGTTSPEGGPYAKFNTVADSVNSQAYELSKRAVAAPATTTSTQTDNGNTSPTLTAANQIIQAAPALIRGSMNPMSSTGDVYIDSSKLTTDSQKNIATAYIASHPNVHLLTSTEVADAQAVDTAIANLNQVKDQFIQLAPDGFLGKVGKSVTNQTQKDFGTDYGNKLDAYNSSTLASALDAFKTIAGSARLSQYGSGITTSSLPKLGQSLFSQGDTKAGGLAKINTLEMNLDHALKTIMPNSYGVPVNVQLPDGSTGVVPLSNLQQAISLGAKQI